MIKKGNDTPKNSHEVQSSDMEQARGGRDAMNTSYKDFRFLQPAQIFSYASNENESNNIRITNIDTIKDARKETEYIQDNNNINSDNKREIDDIKNIKEARKETDHMPDNNNKNSENKRVIDEI